MNKEITLNLFYEEPEGDRWFKYDRYIRKYIRRIIRGKDKIGGQKMVALELLKGLDKLGIPYRFNDYSYAKKNPKQLIGLIGKTYLLDKIKFSNPILFGASVFSHPFNYPDLLEKHSNILKILVPGDWMRIMFQEYYGAKVESWPVGIDTEKWTAQDKKIKFDFLIYDKIRWEKEKFSKETLHPILRNLEENGFSYDKITYGDYQPNDLFEKVKIVRAVIFLCEHETQGIAYQQILSTNTPILAYNQKQYWKDPEFYPHRVKFSPVSSVPYWDERCGEQFESAKDFNSKLMKFIDNLEKGFYTPRNFVVEHLSLEKCALEYYHIYCNLHHSLKND